MNNELRLFISSTFRDLQEEREHLVKKIFPEIRALCRERGITFTEVDLRWGLTDEDVKLGQVIGACLEEVDRCRPYFIGITGNRYGYIPTYIDIQKDPALLQKYPWIEDAAMDGMSITEMEAHYALLGVGTDITDREPVDGRFYFRRHRQSLNDQTDENDELRRLGEFQERIEASGAPVEKFRDPVSLGEMIYDDLITLIKRDFADARPPTPLEQERARHDAFSLSRRRAYIANPDHIRRLNQHAASDDRPLVIYAESGSGKSSLFAFWAEQYRRRHPESHLIEHYVGIGATSTDHYGVIRHICMEIKERFGREEEIPSEPAKLEMALGQWFGYAERELQERDETMVVILDGLNQLQGTALGLRWIPDVIPPSIRLVLSSTVEGTLVELERRNWPRYGMQALSEAEREAIIVRYLAEYHKSLNPEQISRIASDYKCGHPLFLKTVLEELRLGGRHEELDAKIATYLEATGTEDLFQRVLERIEEDYSTRTVRDVMGLLGASRNGLDERELSELSGITPLKIATMVAGLDYHLVRKEGFLTFFHDYLRRAVEKRYLSDEVKNRDVHRRIVDHFSAPPASLRGTRELLNSLEALGDQERMQEILSQIDRFTELWRSEREAVLSVWSSVDIPMVVEAYRRGLAEWTDRESRSLEERTETLRNVAELLSRINAWEESGKLHRERLADFRSANDCIGESTALSSLAWLMKTRGQTDEADELAREAERLARESGDRNSLAIAVANRGLVHAERGEYDEALVCYREWEELVHAMGKPEKVAVANGNRGIVHWHRGEYDEALACYRTQEEIARSLGDRSQLALAIGNRGNIYTTRGEYDEGFACYLQWEDLARSLGDRARVGTAVGNQGYIHLKRGDYDNALACFEKQEEIARGLGDDRGIVLALGNRGTLHFQKGESSKAMECFRMQEELARSIGDRRALGSAVGHRGDVHHSLEEYSEAIACFRFAEAEHQAIGLRVGRTTWLAHIARVLLDITVDAETMPEWLNEHIPEASVTEWPDSVLVLARAYAEESHTLASELSRVDTLHAVQIILARITAAEGEVADAVEQLETLLETSKVDLHRADYHYWLWRLTDASKKIEHHRRALDLSLKLYEQTPRHLHRTRIEELNAAVPPS